MSLILNIDTALETAHVALVQDGHIIATAHRNEQKDHAAWLHPAINGLLESTDIILQQLDAVGVSIGPGSYTGLRVGLSSAKGFCFALDIPLITVGTLEIIAAAVQDKAKDLICPLIDARRMEVFTALYDKSMTEQVSPHALVLESGCFSALLNNHAVLFCGNGAEKTAKFVQHPNAAFTANDSVTEAFARLSQKHLLENRIADLAYAEPLYIKEFYSPARKN